MFDKIRYFFRKLKWDIQKAKKGYSDYDLYDLDYWLIDILPKMLKEFKEKNTSYPCNKHFYLKDNPSPEPTSCTDRNKEFYGICGECTKCQEKYNALIDRIIYLLEESQKDDLDLDAIPDFLFGKEYDNLSKSEKIQYNIKLSNWRKTEEGKEKYKEKCEQEALKLFIDNIHDFWM